MDPLTLTIILSLFNPYINITSQKFSSTPFHLLFIILYSLPPYGSTSVNLCDRPAFKLNIYHKLKLSYIIRFIIIKHALVKELLILQVQNDDIKH